MTTPPIGTIGAGLQPDTGGVPTALESLSAIRGRIDRESVWVPPILAAGAGLQRPGHVLMIVAAHDRADNTSRSLIWRTQEIADRCGVAPPEKVGDWLRKCESNGLFTRVAGGQGRPARVTLPKVPGNASIRLPLATLWETRWVSGALSGPRWGADTAIVCRWLLMIISAWLHEPKPVRDEQQHALRLVVAKPAAVIAKRVGVSVATYERVAARAAAVLADEPWLQMKRLQRRDGGLGPWEITLDWTGLPALCSATSPELAGPASPEGEGTASREVEGTAYPEREGTSKEEDPFFRDPSLEDPSPLRARPGAAAARAAARWHDGGRQKNMTSKPETGPRPTTAPAVITAPQGDTTDTDATADLGSPDAAIFSAWCDAVVSGVTDPTTLRAVTLAPRDLPALQPALRAAFDTGLSPAAVAAFVTSMPSPKISPAGAVDWRLRALADEPSKAATANVERGSRQQEEEEAAFARAAAGRSSARYIRREM